MGNRIRSVLLPSSHTPTSKVMLIRHRQINPTLRIHHTVKSRIPLDSLFNIRAFSDSTFSFLSSTTQAPPAHDHKHDHDHSHEDPPNPNPHYNDITTVLIPLPTLSPHQAGKLESFLQTLLWESRIPAGSDDAGFDIDILRTKGYYKTTEGTEYVIQGVTDIFEIKEVKDQSGGKKEEVQGKLVFIGRGVGEHLRTSFERYLDL